MTLERASADTAPAAPPRSAPQTPPSYAGHGGYYDQGHGHHPYKRRNSWLEEIFD